MDYIIFDLEWNQGSRSSSAREERLPFEIVEIGAVKLNKNREMISEFSELIKPQIYHEMHYITSRLLHLHMKELEKGKVYNKFQPATNLLITNYPNCGGSEMR